MMSMMLRMDLCLEYSMTTNDLLWFDWTKRTRPSMVVSLLDLYCYSSWSLSLSTCSCHQLDPNGSSAYFDDDYVVVVVVDVVGCGIVGVLY